ncbi:hypothetical protein [Methylobacterium platani]|uniref:Uncharacterized protein n=2 Tax=Methylobacterium platani TaxID=427683 RepID=A0A179RYZ2_9HYPH|nr:hypothetical protein [Methylobacterium platani]KMO13349.1 hypothetical protein SQ03_22100 [Methylobacterium platani JCM 14648]OAS16648.1 hypothetical protein A5481_28215 [Methylobacterium platani]
MRLLLLIRSVWLTRGARADFKRSERHRLLADAYLNRSIARLDVADAILEAERTALTHRV